MTDPIRYDHLQTQNPELYRSMVELDGAAERAAGKPSTPGVFTEADLASANKIAPGMTRLLGAAVGNATAAGLAQALDVVRHEANRSAPAQNRRPGSSTPPPAPRPDVSRRLRYIREIPTSSYNSNGERERHAQLMRLAQEPGLTQWDMTEIARAAPIVRYQSWQNEIVHALVRRAASVQHGIDLATNFQTSSSNSHGESEIRDALLHLANRADVSPSDVDALAAAAPRAHYQSWQNQVVQAVLQRAVDVPQALGVISHFRTSSSNSHGERAKWDGMLATIQRFSLSYDDVERIARAAPSAHYQSWENNVIESLLPHTQNIDQSIGLIRRFKTRSSNSDGERAKYNALMALARKPLSGYEADAIMAASSMAHHQSWISDVREQVIRSSY